MIEKIQYGPVEFLPPVSVSQAILKIDGIKTPKCPYTTYVFLDEIRGEEIEKLKEECNYAGDFSMSETSSATVQLDITKALNHSLETMPNFHIVFLTRYEGEGRGDPEFGFEHLDILHEFPGNTDFKESTCVFRH